MPYRSMFTVQSLETRRLLSATASLDIGSTHFYSFDDGVHGTELWASNLDGSNARMVKDLNQVLRSQGSDPDSFNDVNGSLVFVATGSDTGREVWRSDGTDAGTFVIADVYPLASPSNPRDFQWVDGHLTFLANNSSFLQLWTTDGTAQGSVRLTQQFDSIKENTVSSDDGLRDFQVSEYPSGQTFDWRSDGTVAGTTRDVPAATVGGDGILRVFGSSAADQITVTGDDTQTTVVIGDTFSQSFDNTTFSKVFVDGSAGNDVINVNLHDSLDPTIRGGAGNDTITVTNTIDVSITSQTPDVNKNYRQAFVFGDAGNDTFIGSNSANDYRGGDGRDTIDYTADGGYEFVWTGSRWAPTTPVKAKVSLDDIANDGRNGDDNVHSDIEVSLPTAIPIVIAEPRNYLLKSDHSLHITGSMAGDRIEVRISKADSEILEVVVNGVVNTLHLADVSSIIVNGGAGADSIRIDQAITLPTSLYGGAGNDILIGAAGDDRIDGQDGDDRIYSYAGNDTLYGGAGRDRIYAGDGNDWISAGDDNDTVYGEAGDDRMFGGNGKDFLFAGTGKNLVRGDAGTDRITVQSIVDDIHGNSDDRIIKQIIS